MRTAVDLTGLSEKRIRRWVAAGKLRTYRVEGVGTPRYDLEQLRALARGEPPDPPGTGLRGKIEAAGEQLLLALDEARQVGAVDGETAAAARAVLTLVRSRLSLGYGRGRRLISDLSRVA